MHYVKGQRLYYHYFLFTLTLFFVFSSLYPPVDPPPSGLDFYIHRSGRTGRKGQSGRSILLLSSDFRRHRKNEHDPDAFLRYVRRLVGCL